MKINVNELENYKDQEITFSGYVDAIRDKKWVMFVILRDNTGKVQNAFCFSAYRKRGMDAALSPLF